MNQKYTMNVLVVKTWDYPKMELQTPSGDGKWEDIQFYFSEWGRSVPDVDFDFLVVLNYPPEDIKLPLNKQNTLLITQEPPYKRYGWFKNSFPEFSHVITQFPVSGKDIIHQHPCLPWWVGKDYAFLKGLEIQDVPKRKDLCWITSKKNFHKGHTSRLSFLDTLSENIEFDLYGKGYQEVESKWEVLKDYKYSLAIENGKFDYYWTEKLADCFLSYTMPIYHGCENINEFFPEEAMVKIDIGQPEVAIEKIKEALQTNYWEKNIEALHYAREIVLEKYQFFPFVSKFIKANYVDEGNEQVFIKKQGWPEGKKPNLYRKALHKIRTLLMK